MSGICGIINFNGAPVEPAVLAGMAQAAAHRGPDGIRTWIDGPVGLAHLALNITPESLREQQPLVSQQGDLVLTADARIDNRAELIQILTARGHLVGPDPTDADLILAAYRCWGSDCPAQLIGDFAFAIWDARRQRLFAARDPMAMRAFYYRVEPDRLLFGTEVKQILAVSGVPRRIFEPAVGAYLIGQFEPLAWTFYEGIAQLEPGHGLAVETGNHRTWRYWDIDPAREIRYANEDDYTEHFLELFKDAVNCRLRSVKPVGLLLSGGMDSGSIAATAGWQLQHNRQTPHPGFRTYCWAFEELSQCDERHISDGLVHHYNFPVRYIQAEQAGPLADYPAHGPDQDEPYIGAYQALLESSFAAAQSDGVGNLLSGDRGDLMVGGWTVDYVRLLRAKRWQALRTELLVQRQLTGLSLPSLARTYVVWPLLKHCWKKGKTWPKRRLHRLRRSSKSGNPPWLPPEFAQRAGVAETTDPTGSVPAKIDGFTRRRRYEWVFTPMHMRGMVWSERSQARFGLGFADPWSDRRLASFVLAIPQQVLNRPLELNKRLVRQAMHGIMPEPVRQAACKIVPTPLYKQAIREWEKETIRDLVTNSMAAAGGYIDQPALSDHFEAIRRGEPIHACFWWALTLEMWLRLYWT